MLNVSKICAGLLSFLNIIQITCSFIFGENYPLPSVIVLPILGMSLLLMIALAAQQTQKYNVELLEKLNSLNEDKLIDVYEKLVQKKSLLKEEGTYFIENFNKLDKNFRCYVIAYLKHKEYKKQIWCVFDYLFEDSLKIDSTEENVFYESFELVPLKYEEKEAIYKEYNLQRDIAKEYLNCIGVDILWGSKTDIVDGSFKFHSLDFIQGKIEEVRKKLDSDGSLTSVFYCLVYMSSKYKCSFSMAQMISLIQNEEIVNQDLYAVISDAGSRIPGSNGKSKEEIRAFIAKITDLLKGYYFIEFTRKGGRKIEKYKFSYDILECFERKMSDTYPDEETVKRWVLVKLVSNNNMFLTDRYFFDCSNLLVMSDFLEDKEFCILSSYLLRIMDANNCWVYNGYILKRLRSVEENIRKQWMHTEAVKRAASSHMFYVSDYESMQYGIYFLAGEEDCGIHLDDFALDSYNEWLPEMEKYSSALVGYFKLLYKVFGTVITTSFEFGRKYQDVEIESFAEPLPEIIRQLLMLCILCLNEYNRYLSQEIFNKGIERLLNQLVKLRACAEANEFVSTVEEMLLWVKSELAGEKDRVYRKIYTGMLIETSNSNMLYFVYGLLNMALVKDREIVYKNRNPLLDFISQSIFYFKVITQAEGITRYVDVLLKGQHSIDLKLNIAINLFVRTIPCREILRKFIVENMDRAETLFLSRLEFQDTEQMEKYIALLLLYNANMNSVEFTEKILGQVSDYVAQSECVDKDRIAKYLEVIIEKKCPEEEMPDIVDEINQIDSTDFAV